MLSTTPAATAEARAKLAEIERQRQEAIKLWDAIHGKDLKAVAALMNDEFLRRDRFVADYDGGPMMRDGTPADPHQFGVITFSPNDGRDPDLEAEARRQPGGPDAAEFERSL